MNDSEKIKAAIIIQNKLRYNLFNINCFNNNYDKIKNRILKILDRVQINYEINIINQDKYNIALDSLDDVLKTLYKLPYPLKLNNLVTHKIIDLKCKIFEVKEKVIDIICKCGSLNIKDIIDLLISDNENNFKNSENYINFLNEIFIPNSAKIVKSETIDNKINVKNNNDIINLSLLEKVNGAIIEIPCKDKNLNIYGYFKQDPLNIYKNKAFIKIKINSIKSKCINLNLSPKYIDAYIEQINLKDIVIDSVEKITRKMAKDENYFNKLKIQLLSSLVKEFLMSNLSDQRRILTLFLISEEESSKHMAYLLYDMITTSSDTITPKFQVEDIFKSLHWTIQRKFKLAYKNVEKYRKKLLNLSEENISYEDRIIQLKASDAIKSKALDKLKEVRANKDSSKAQTYLDGILKIPFGTYKKENILSFLEDFTANINNLFKDLKLQTKEINENDDTMIYIKNNLNNLFDLIEKNKYETENKVSDLINILDSKLNDINNLISSDDKYKDLVFRNETDLSLDKLNKIKNINSEIEECDNSDILNKIENEISINIKLELENLRNKMLDIDSPRILKSKNINSERSFTYEYENDKQDKNIGNLNEFNKWKSIESHLINLLNEWTLYKHSKKEYMINVKNILDDCIHGQKDAKKHIERLIAQWINGKMEGNVFGFQGPPGVGKTTLCKKGLAKCLRDQNDESRPFAFIALGGASHGSYLDGHHYTYLGSTWGRIVEILIETKCMNPIIYIDELDKLSNTPNGRELVGILTHLTDPSQNEEFTDKYFSGVKLDLSKCLIVFSYNDSKLVDPILRDRITEVKVKSINKKEKKYITKHYLLPEILCTVGYELNEFIFDDEVIDYIIDTYTYEAGVRKLKEKLFEIIRDFNLNKIIGETEHSLPYTITKEYVTKLFSENGKVKFTKIAKQPQIGHINGLYATSNGTGGITIIEVMRTPSDTKLSLELTGNQGDVMKESMKCAKTVAWNLLPHDIKKKIKEEWDDIGSFGLHIHCPDAAMPKDGPSAGIAITSAILSQLCKVKIKNTIAMTGEIDLNGKVHAIGGLDSKLDGAKRAGVLKVLVPEDNEDDYNRIINNLSEDDKKIYLENFEIKLVSRFEDVIKEVFVENNLDFNYDYI